jgi:carbon storage regulator
VLIIRRKAGERLILDGNIEIEVLDARPNYVKLGITAPDAVTVVRQEAQLTRESNLKASRTVTSTDILSLASKLGR